MRYVFLLLVICFSFMCGAYCQDNSTQADKQQKSYGVLVKASTDSVTISEYNEDKDAEQQVVYLIKAETKIDGALDIKSIASGANVEVTYESTDAGRVVKTIIVDAQTGD
jgi:hypothetical protein